MRHSVVGCREVGNMSVSLGRNTVPLQNKTNPAVEQACEDICLALVAAGDAAHRLWVYAKVFVAIRETKSLPQVMQTSKTKMKTRAHFELSNFEPFPRITAYLTAGMLLLGKSIYK